MESNNIHASAEGVRFSNSPRRYTQVMQGLQSPARSVHPEHSGTVGMQSIHSQADFGLRTTDYFEDSSEDEEPLPGSAITSPDLDAIMPGSGSPSKKKKRANSTQPMVSECEPKRLNIRSDEPQSEGYERLDSNLNQHVPDRAPATSDTSFNGSVEEMDFPAEANTPQQPKQVRLSSTQKFRTSGLWGPQHFGNHSPFHEKDARASMYSNKAEQRLGIHAAAYEVALNAMLKDPGLTELDPLSNPRNSQIPPRLSINSKKKVAILKPPPLASADKGSFPDDPQRTPYPFGKPSPLSRGSDETLTLSIRRCYRNSASRSTTLTIPSDRGHSSHEAYSIPGAAEKDRAISFDDQKFFSELRSAYASLAGPYRLFSARSLTRIAIKGRATKAADALYGWIPSTPTPDAEKGSSQSYVEKAYTYYKRPSLGRGRVPYVKWARELAAAAAPHNQKSPQLEEDDQDVARNQLDSEPSEGLEFVLGWSISRILLAVLLVILLAIAATFLWIFLGKSTPASWPAPAHAGFRGAGDRVASGILIGVLILFLGMTGVTGWLGVSWLVM